MRKPRVISVSDPTGRSFLHGIAEFAKSVGGWQIVRAPGFNQDSENPESLRKQGVIGQFRSQSVAQWLADNGVPAVNLSSSHENWPIPSIMEDNEAIGRMAAEHFVSRGFEHLACFGGDGYYWGEQRCKSFMQAAREAGLPEPTRIHRPSMILTKLQGHVVQAVRALPKPLAILAANDSEALDVAYFLMNADIAMPEEVALLGVDNDDTTCPICPVPLSSVAPDFRMAGYRGAEILWQMMQGEYHPPETQLIPPLRIVVRQSTDITAINDSDVARVLTYLREHLHESITVEDAAEEVAMSRRSLEKRFRGALNRTPHEELHRMRMLKAKQLLHETDMAMANIALACGFGDPAYFSRAFSKAEGLPPSEFRRRHRLT